ncbi:hypothetical protein KHS38_14690 [Mucilaginibacter sp. Bleaf8]|uniref:P-loop NTPase fold protein n=1 Tax=Mucilaginibacter sp. Bleaf8 TaxID=2834430 RepID=UPI001BCC3DB2|nr:P-loop NTPase fold protein [Mucilaginibacter sp. Bleaf8]MBS7565656.1 hypothetical protein [Mucilaginibacter sp. Bleaf8]
MNELEIQIGNEYKIKFEKGKDLDTSVFKDLYLSAARNVSEILNQQRSKKKKSEFFQESDYNNVIAFVGERGTGKSSSMLSFAQALIDNSNSQFESTLFDNHPIIRACNFHSIDVVDPSLFTQKDTLFEIIISKMFLSFQKDVNAAKETSDQSEKRKIIKQFQEVFKNLKTVHKEKKEIYEQEVIDVLAELANGTNLRQSFHELVLEYLKYFKKEKGTLLVIIDDFDLRISEAYSMLEDIRQFLIQDNVIVLLACKMDQLAQSVELKISKEFKELASFKQKEARETANKYLEKLLPTDHRKNTPKLILTSVVTDKSTEYVNKFKIKLGNEELVKGKTIHEGILQLIYDRLGLFISYPQVPENFIVPGTIRELVDIVSFVHSLNESNIAEFLSYFYSEIRNLDDSTVEQLFQDIEQISPLYLNEMVRTSVGEKYNLSVPQNLKVAKDSFGTILGYLEAAKDSLDITERESFNLIAYIKTCYSIRVRSTINQQDWVALNYIMQNELLRQQGSIFPREATTRFTRDVFEFSGMNELQKSYFSHDLSKDDLLFLGCFISNYGRQEIATKRPESFNDGNFLNKVGPTVDYATFNCLSFIYHLGGHSNLLENLNIILKDDKPSYLLDQIKIWPPTKSYYLFFNAHFLQEFINELSILSKSYRETLGNFAETLFEYLVANSTKALDAINKRYPFLNFDIEWFISNPIFTYWEKNFQKVNTMLNRVYEQQTTRMETEAGRRNLGNLARTILSKNRKYFNRTSGLSQTAIKRAMTAVTDSFKDYSDIYRLMTKSRNLMNRNFEQGLIEFEELLLQLMNG